MKHLDRKRRVLQPIPLNSTHFLPNTSLAQAQPIVHMCQPANPSETVPQHLPCPKTETPILDLAACKSAETRTATDSQLVAEARDPNLNKRQGRRVVEV